MDVYQFGVYSGLSMRAISQTLLKAGVRFHRLWGFDSFHGLPDERTSAGATPRYVANNGFTRGNFDIVGSWKADSAESAMHRIKRYINGTRVSLVPGFYNTSLTRELAHRMRPALYVDVDVDLYSSTIDALGWMYSHKLLVPGSVIGFDDFKGKYQRDGAMFGEALAHKELAEQHRAVFAMLPASKSLAGCCPSFVVTSVGTAQNGFCDCV